MPGADRDHHRLRRQRLAVVETEAEALARALECDHGFILECRRETLLKRKPVGAERLDRNRMIVVGIAEAPVGAEPLKREAAVRIVEVRGEALGFQQHALRHLGAPAVQRRAEDAEADAAGAQMRGEREAVRPRTDNGDLRGFSHDRSIPKRDRPATGRPPAFRSGTPPRDEESQCKKETSAARTVPMVNRVAGDHPLLRDG